jgi:hypothetical protein
MGMGLDMEMEMKMMTDVQSDLRRAVTRILRDVLRIKVQLTPSSTFVSTVSIVEGTRSLHGSPARPLGLVLVLQLHQHVLSSL